jgi:threonine dehydrogenase-like Zn-dependent dehydrogenase
VFRHSLAREAASAIGGRVDRRAFVTPRFAPVRIEDVLVAEVARRVGASPLVPWSGRQWLQDGPGVVYDTIGSVETVETSLRLLMTGGSLVVSGVEPPKRFEWTPLYFKELRVVGSNGSALNRCGEFLSMRCCTTSTSCPRALTSRR